MKLVRLLVVLLFLLPLACSRERARAVYAAGEPPETERDYQGMLERARLRKTAEDSLSTLEQARNNFLKDTGRLPSNFTELVTGRYLSAIPLAPEAQEFVYDATSGNIQLRPLNPSVPNPEMEEPPVPTLIRTNPPR